MRKFEALRAGSQLGATPSKARGHGLGLAELSVGCPTPAVELAALATERRDPILEPAPEAERPFRMEDTFHAFEVTPRSLSDP